MGAGLPRRQAMDMDGCWSAMETPPVTGWCLSAAPTSHGLGWLLASNGHSTNYRWVLICYANKPWTWMAAGQQWRQHRLQVDACLPRRQVMVTLLVGNVDSTDDSCVHGQQYKDIDKPWSWTVAGSEGDSRGHVLLMTIQVDDKTMTIARRHWKQ